MSHLGAPEFDGPVKRGGDEEMREVNRSSGTVTAQPSHWTVMALEHLSYTRLTVTHTHENDCETSANTTIFPPKAFPAICFYILNVKQTTICP